jgi:phosphatidylglycerol:prolipoprotein diacylglycerol transferase
MYGEISFPGLGLSFNPSRVAFSIGSKAIYWYGIIIAVGFLLAVFYALRRCDQFGLTQDNIIDMLICAVPAAIIGARAYYCIFSWSLYRDDPIRVLYIWEGGLAIYGGVIGAVLGLLLYTKVKKVKTSAMLDIGGLGLLIGQSIGRWGNFMNREAFGAVTDSFLRMGLTDANGNVTYYHPTFLYESLWNALGLLLLHFYSKRRKFDGQIFIMYLGWYGLGRVFIEGLRMDSLYVGSSNLRVSQLVAGLCFLCAAIFLIYDKIFREHDPDELYVNRAARPEEAVQTEEVAEEATEETTEKASEAAQDEENPEMGNDSEENEGPATEAPEASDEE